MSIDPREDPRGPRLLRRLETFLDVGYALLFLEMLQALPKTEEFDPTRSDFAILQVFLDRPTEMLRLIIGLGLVVIYWRLSARFTGSLVRSDGRLASLVLLQFLCVCFFIYFAIADPRLEGGPSSPALQALALALAGAFALAGFRHARRSGFVDERLSEADRDEIRFRGYVEPVTSLIQVGTAYIGPLVWTVGWFLIPIPVAWVVKKLTRS